jgi:hypothetical protein
VFVCCEHLICFSHKQLPLPNYPLQVDLSGGKVESDPTKGIHSSHRKSETADSNRIRTLKMLRLRSLRQLAGLVSAPPLQWPAAGGALLGPLASSSAQQRAGFASEAFEDALEEELFGEEREAHGARRVHGIPIDSPRTLDDYNRLLTQLSYRKRCEHGAPGFISLPESAPHGAYQQCCRGQGPAAVSATQTTPRGNKTTRTLFRLGQEAHVLSHGLLSLAPRHHPAAPALPLTAAGHLAHPVASSAAGHTSCGTCLRRCR